MGGWVGLNSSVDVMLLYRDGLEVGLRKEVWKDGCGRGEVVWM